MSQPATALLPLYVQPVGEQTDNLPVPVQHSSSDLEPATLPFIEANTKPVSCEHLQKDCIIPVFSKDNEVTISHQSFIAAIQEAAYRVFPFDTIGTPSIRVSHIVKGRIPHPPKIILNISVLQTLHTFLHTLFLFLTASNSLPRQDCSSLFRPVSAAISVN